MNPRQKRPIFLAKMILPLNEDDIHQNSELLPPQENFSENIQETGDMHNDEDVKKELKEHEERNSTYFNHKKNIQFHVALAVHRRNIDKHVVRSVFRYYQDVRPQIIEEFKKAGINENMFEKCSTSIDKIREIEKSKRSTARDFAKLINNFLNSQDTRIITKCCLIYSYNRLSTDYPRIKQKNIELYKQSVKDYIDYIDSLLS
jgi:hypothetical protein